MRVYDDCEREADIVAPDISYCVKALTDNSHKCCEILNFVFNYLLYGKESSFLYTISLLALAFFLCLRIQEMLLPHSSMWESSNYSVRHGIRRLRVCANGQCTYTVVLAKILYSTYTVSLHPCV